MPVDEQVQRVLECYATLGAPPLTALSPEAARRRPTVVDAVNALRQQRGEAVVPEAVGAAYDEVIQGPEGEIRTRIYRADASGPLPILMYFHSGGWVLGDLDHCDATCRALTNLARCVVISVAYRRAPEHRFPAAAQDAYAATQWAAAAASALGADPLRLAVCGEGAGGNLAAVVALMARDSNTRVPIYQALVYPITNYAFNTPSYEHHAYVRPLTKKEMRWFWNHYLPDDGAGANYYASPLRAEDLSDLPPGLILTAEYDVLRDEGEAYGRRLEEAGVPMVVRRCGGMVHGFLDMAPMVEEARRRLLEIADWLQTAFQVSPKLMAAEEPALSSGEIAPVEVQEGLHMAAITVKVASAPLERPSVGKKKQVVGSVSLEEDAGRGEAAPGMAADQLAEEAPGTQRAPLESGVLVRVGMEVLGSDGRHMGKVKAVRVSDFVIDRRFRRDLAVPFKAIHEAGDRVVLSVPAREAANMDWSHLSW